MSDQGRQPQGVPVGGQFAAQSHAEVDISLAPSRADVASRLAVAEAEFAFAGGRGIDFAEEVDGLRREMSLLDRAEGVRTINDPAAADRAFAEGILSCNGQLMDDRRDWAPPSTDWKEGIYTVPHPASPDVVWADEDGDLPLSGGGYGNPGCDSCGVEDAAMVSEGRFLCELHAGDNGFEKPESGNPAYPNGQCSACGGGLSESGSCRDFECQNGPDEPDEQTLDEMRDFAGTTVIDGYERLTSSEDLDRVREFHPDFPHEKWAAAVANLRDVRDWLNGVSEEDDSDSFDDPYNGGSPFPMPA